MVKRRGYILQYDAALVVILAVPTELQSSI
jgi:hypothetical protein